jgi:hypothetical protein
MRYRCCFLNEDDQVVRVEELNSYDDGGAPRGAMSLLPRIGGTEPRDCIPRAPPSPRALRRRCSKLLRKALRWTLKLNRAEPRSAMRCGLADDHCSQLNPVF